MIQTAIRARLKRKTRTDNDKNTSRTCLVHKLDEGTSYVEHKHCFCTKTKRFGWKSRCTHLGRHKAGGWSFGCGARRGMGMDPTTSATHTRERGSGELARASHSPVRGNGEGSPGDRSRGRNTQTHGPTYGHSAVPRHEVPGTRITTTLLYLQPVPERAFAYIPKYAPPQSRILDDHKMNRH